MHPQIIIILGLVDIKINDFLNFSDETHTRISHRLKLLEPHCKKAVFKLSFFPRTARDWNQLLPDMPPISSCEEFKTTLVNFFFIRLIVACSFYLYIL